jgi:hypothetical protein
MKNTGLAQFRVSGNVTYQEKTTARDVYMDHFDPITIVPGVTRNVQVKGPKALAKGQYLVRAELEYINEIVEGVYTLQVD